MAAFITGLVVYDFVWSSIVSTNFVISLVKYNLGIN